MSNESDEQFRLDVTSLLSEVHTSQKALTKSLDEYIVANNKRLDDLEHTVNGNGSRGLAEDVRSIKGKWGVVYGFVIIVLGAVAQAAALHFFH